MKTNFPIRHWFYDNQIEPMSEIEDVEEAIVTRQIDKDLISNWDWVSEILTDDLPHELIEYILKNKKNPAIVPLYKMVREQISSILDKE